MSSTQFTVPDQQQDHDQMSSSLDLYSEVVRPGTDDPALNETNFGLGVFSNPEYYQNVESLRRGFFARNAFEGPIMGRAIREAKIGLAKDALSSPNNKSTAELVEKGHELWDDRNEEQQREALKAYAGLNQYRPTHHRMAAGRTEMSRAKKGRLIDNVFGRVSEAIHRASDEAREALAKLGGD